jgi:hypothetical protein
MECPDDIVAFLRLSRRRQSRPQQGLGYQGGARAPRCPGSGRSGLNPGGTIKQEAAARGAQPSTPGCVRKGNAMRPTVFRVVSRTTPSGKPEFALMEVSPDGAGEVILSNSFTTLAEAEAAKAVLERISQS